MNYNDDIKIDETALETEWLNQAARYLKYAELAAAADKEVRRLEERMKVLRSEIILEESNKSVGKRSPTGQMIEATFRVHPQHRKLKRKLNDAQHDADILRGAVFAFQQRKTALENLVMLHGQGYFAEPNVKRTIRKE